MEAKANPDLLARRRRKKILWVVVGVLAVGVSAAVVVAVLLSKKIIPLGGNSDSSVSSADDSSGTGKIGPGSGSNSGSSGSNPGSDSDAEPVECSTADDIPSEYKDTWLDPTSWYDMTGFNCSFTAELVGDLPVVGLNSSWDNSAKANPNVPAIEDSWGDYTKRPIRGVNLGGWLSLEPFITPSLFDYDSKLGIVDEYSLCKHLGPEKAAETLEKHYATFITEDDFKAIADAGLDHLRIPFSYWAVQTYEGDPYVPNVSWRYLLRGIEWARKYGLRIKLDLHALPGSQNGWNHSGRSGKINFIEGTDGAQNAERALDIHKKLATFFAQDRYKGVIAFYGLGNEPGRDIQMGPLVQWTDEAFNVVSKAGLDVPQIFSDSMRGLPTWQGQLSGHGDKLVIDTHMYAIFDPNLIAMEHSKKISLACKDWASLVSNSMSGSGGFGPTMVGEWSQADTDCTLHLNGVGMGTRWEGTFQDTVGTPRCPAGDDSCSCEKANADPSTYSDEYRLFLKTFAIAQMDAFEKSWGWFYWTWKTESAHQWSYEAGLKGKFMPEIAYDRDWDCSKAVPSFGKLSETF
ncbi:hypothetical protein jhhlp_005809 [Lomentospora prolificans]|uniref:glucan 1,3-beta-glucosidase n=1 Tax=Lomentospora prolificans TaxID=41688 RepID=A0A2N3N449_9PEZI|nr:hypothetical protein jhhlp_005809 [Lomentospora prolificans]